MKHEHTVPPLSEPSNTLDDLINEIVQITPRIPLKKKIFKCFKKLREQNDGLQAQINDLQKNLRLVEAKASAWCEDALENGR